jgi:hypothetical protein
MRKFLAVLLIFLGMAVLLFTAGYGAFIGIGLLLLSYILYPHKDLI